MQPATNSAGGKHLPYEAKHIDDVEWETIRWPGETGKMLFHPRPERPTEPNAGILRLEPGAHHPIHNHDFAQVWYILSGEFKIDDNLYKAGTMIFHPDPHFEDEFHTETGDPHRAVSRSDYRRPSDLRRPLQRAGTARHRC